MAWRLRRGWLCEVRLRWLQPQLHSSPDACDLTENQITSHLVLHILHPAKGIINVKFLFFLLWGLYVILEVILWLKCLFFSKFPHHCFLFHCTAAPWTSALFDFHHVIILIVKAIQWCGCREGLQGLLTPLLRLVWCMALEIIHVLIDDHQLI